MDTSMDLFRRLRPDVTLMDFGTPVTTPLERGILHC
jgi:hypothetical protein